MNIGYIANIVDKTIRFSIYGYICALIIVTIITLRFKGADEMVVLYIPIFVIIGLLIGLIVGIFHYSEPKDKIDTKNLVSTTIYYAKVSFIFTFLLFYIILIGTELLGIDSYIANIFLTVCLPIFTGWGIIRGIRIGLLKKVIN